MKLKITIAIFVIIFLGLILLLHVNGKTSDDYAYSEMASLNEDVEDEDSTENSEKVHNESNAHVEPATSDSIFEICKPAPLVSEHTEGSIGRGNMFHEDEEVPSPKATVEDYKGSGWSRGHMCPAGDNKWDAEAMYQSFSLINVCPQNASLNSGLWNSLEIDCRNWAKRFHDIYIICGPVFFQQDHEVIGINEIYVPEAFFKVVLCLNGKPKGLGVIVKNTAGNKKKDIYYNSIDQVERITGMDFFPLLSDDVEDEVESNLDMDMWK